MTRVICITAAFGYNSDYGEIVAAGFRTRFWIHRKAVIKQTGSDFPSLDLSIP